MDEAQPPTFNDEELLYSCSASVDRVEKPSRSVRVVQWEMVATHEAPRSPATTTNGREQTQNAADPAAQHQKLDLIISSDWQERHSGSDFSSRETLRKLDQRCLSLCRGWPATLTRRPH
jgi:hypothetical protein